METRFTSWDATILLAEKTGISIEQAKKIMQAQAELAYQHADASYPIPGIGRLYTRKRPASTKDILFGPGKGQKVVLPEKTMVDFRVTYAAKLAVLNRSPKAKTEI